jgi:hypothetical protein
MVGGTFSRTLSLTGGGGVPRCHAPSRAVAVAGVGLGQDSDRHRAPAALEQGDLVDEVPERASPPAALEENPSGPEPGFRPRGSQMRSTTQPGIRARNQIMSYRPLSREPKRFAGTLRTTRPSARTDTRTSPRTRGPASALHLQDVLRLLQLASACPRGLQSHRSRADDDRIAVGRGRSEPRRRV